MKIIVWLLFFTVLFFGCGGEEVNKPTAIIEELPRLQPIGSDIDFLSLSTHASLMEWDMGDGTILHGEVISHRYYRTEDFQITLTAYDDNGHFSKDSTLIAIRNRWFQSLYIDKISDVDPLENPWDSDDFPDVLIFMGEVGNFDKWFLYAMPENYNLEDYPFGGDLLFGSDLFFTDTDWFFILIDNDKPMENFGEEDQYMFSRILNPVRDPVFDNSENVVIDQGMDMTNSPTGDYVIRLTWQINPFN